MLGGGSNLLVADAGFDGVVVRDVRSGIEVPDASACAGATLTGPRGDALGRRRPVRGRAGADRHRGAVRHPRLHGRDAGAERRRVRPGGVAEHRDRPGVGPRPRQGPHAPAASRSRSATGRRCSSGRCARPTRPTRRPLVADAALRRARRDVPAAPRHAVRARSPTPSWPARSASRSAGAPRWRTSATPCWPCAPARAWCSTRPTTTRGARARSSPTRSSARRRRPRCRTTRRASRPTTTASRPAPPGSSSGPGSRAASAPPARRRCRPSTRSR